MIQHFRTAYVAHNSGHDFQPLKELCDEIKFCTTGYESEDDLPKVMEETLKDFDAEKDIVVAVGNVNNVLLMGAILARKASHVQSASLLGLPVLVSQFFTAVYKDKQYTVREIVLGKE